MFGYKIYSRGLWLDFNLPYRLQRPLAGILVYQRVSRGPWLEAQKALAVVSIYCMDSRGPWLELYANIQALDAPCLTFRLQNGSRCPCLKF